MSFASAGGLAAPQNLALPFIAQQYISACKHNPVPALVCGDVMGHQFCALKVGHAKIMVGDKGLPGLLTYRQDGLDLGRQAVMVGLPAGFPVRYFLKQGIHGQLPELAGREDFFGWEGCDIGCVECRQVFCIAQFFILVGQEVNGCPDRVAARIVMDEQLFQFVLHRVDRDFKFQEQGKVPVSPHCPRPCRI